MAQTNIRTGILAVLLVLGNGTTCDARPLLRRPAKVQQAEVKTPELQQAAERVRAAATQLDTARKQLEAARALVRAAEAEHRASIADREALSLKERAKTLADASGFPKSALITPSQLVVGQPAPPASQNVVVPASAPVESAKAELSAGNTLSPGYGRIQQPDFNAQLPEQAPLR